MSETLKSGDVVKLKSGGPKMTVTDVGHDEIAGQTLVWCVWFDDKQIEKRGAFPLQSVELAN